MNDNFDLENINPDEFLADESGDRQIDPQERELLTLKLLRKAIQDSNQDDPVMKDFAEIVLPNLLKVAIGVTAKGGKFFDEIDAQWAAEGKEKVRRDNAADQSLNTHLLNGLFPANQIEKRLEQLDTTIARGIEEFERRLTIAGFILHDFEKFPDVSQDCRKLDIQQQQEIIVQKLLELELNKFIDPDNPETYQEYLDDLTVLICNAQRRWDTNWNFSEYGLQPKVHPKLLRQLADLTCLADSFASIIKHPQDAVKTKFKELLHSLSNGQLSLTYHHLAENRGVLTNVVNNAVMDLHTSLNTDDEIFYEPLLYLPTGVIYLKTRNAPDIPTDGLGDRIVKKIKSLCFKQLKARQTGFSRDGKGMKYADYYNLFCDGRGLMEIGLDATLKILSSNKKSVAPARTEKLKNFQRLGILSAHYNFQLKEDIRMDQLAEFSDTICRKIWGDKYKELENLYKQRVRDRKKKKSLAELPEPQLPPEGVILKVAEFWELTEYIPQLRQIQNINQSLKENKLKGNTGGIPYEWYYLSTKYLEANPGLEDIRETAEQLITFIADLIEPIIAQYSVDDGWQDVREWVKRVVMLPQQEIASNAEQVEIFLKELNAYQAAKKSGRGKEIICSISNSPYSVKEQMEAEVLFTPQVYTNKQHLGGSNAKRNISSIAGIEMMLRQILMNQTQAVGKRFEDGKYRYLYFYPTYYFTPETNKFLQQAYQAIAQTRFDTELRNHFISKEGDINLTKANYQSVDFLLMDEELKAKQQLPDKDPNYRKDRTFKLSYPDDQPLTFYFIALPPGRDPTDTESWVMPTWLAFVMPMILDVKTVVSESPIPPFTDGTEFEETVFLDSAPQAFRVLTGVDRFRLDYILEGWRDGSGRTYPSPLKALTAAYAIHLDVNPKRGKGGYDANWGKLTELAKDFQSSPLNVFSYLSKWRRGKEAESPPMSKIKLYADHFYPCFDPYFNSIDQKEKSPLNHPKELTRLYRKFYRANKSYNPKANAVLKPIDVAAQAILNADNCLMDSETLVAVTAAEVSKLMDRVHSSTAEGRWVVSDREVERQKVLEFAQYFVLEVFEGGFKGDRARLAGKQLNLIRDTCEFLYRLEQDQENQDYKARKAAQEEE
ncbi:type I-D CRISPR-associated protein Cas10d/Csc3 [Picosynechococcus sp. NKBG15041c]|uniref:type I-D CRISPR-associated protein Cas10d/Csc3 n=1 Tax=Picosynechococcus sp. NKBG15041c TaxID=1407650 RepID=UPI000419E534|nr:type I-D CRISPR-associated protein Cas10d/Csc3 [Picosynechococcus sp. NKBG15041c]